MKRIFIFLNLFVFSCVALATQSKISTIKFFENKIGIYFSTNTIPQHHFSKLIKPQRLVVDLLNTTALKKLKKAPTGLVQKFNYHVYPHKTRLVFSFKKPFHFTSHLHPHHLQLIIKETPNKKKIIKPRDAMVVIDPGHGGKDPGATGPKGIHEKNVVLKISKYLQHDLMQMAGIKADLTRHGDYFITLRGRLRLARKDKADVFMAIHADSFPNKHAHGASVFALSTHGATSEAARWLAHSENRAVLGGAQFSDQSKNIQSVLLQLSQSITIQRSLQFGEQVKNALSKVTPLHSNHVEQARFVVLKAPDIPSLLVETGFISNYQEEKNLNTPSYQKKIARALATGIRHYLYQHPPGNSLIAEQQRGRLNYTLSHTTSVHKLARYFNVNEKKLLKLNHLKATTQLHKGMHLKIPTANIKH